MLVVLLELVLVGAALLVLLPTMVLFLEVLLAVTRCRDVTPPVGERKRVAVLMPAHNEASIIAATLRSIIPQLVEFDRLLVVADNCTDQTAAVAASEGAEVIVRVDPARRGKGYALDFGVRHLTGNAPHIVIVVDADCLVTPGSLDRLARLCAQTARPIQALYLMHAGANAGPKMRIAELAWLVKNQVRPAGLHRLGLPCQLTGTGMAFPWARIATANLATGHIVEDLKLGIDLARSGAPPLFCPEALVTSDFPTSTEGVGGQRTRWEHGHLSVVLSEAPALFVKAVASLNVDLMALALDLSVPPLALLTLQVMALWCASTVFYFFAQAQLPLDIATLAAALIALSAIFSWARFGRHVISFPGLAYAAIYAAAKIPLYARFLVARQLEWVRSKRDGDKS
jgi:cellulose synthase/poly-beta-1,6-N-acetylglucosamine synthase-like glycosyltransferase